VVKLLGIAEQDRTTGEVAVRVHPAMVPVTHPLASVRESYNAVFVEGEAPSATLMFYGRGAGGFPTASAVLGDVIDAAVNLSQGTHGTIGTFGRARIRAIDETSAEYLLSLDVADRPASCTPSPACSPATVSASAPPSRRASAPRPAWCSSPTRPTSRPCRPRCASCASSTSCAAIGGLLRVIGG
jgi:hypothetical protein